MKKTSKTATEDFSLCAVRLHSQTLWRVNELSVRLARGNSGSANLSQSMVGCGMLWVFGEGGTERLGGGGGGGGGEGGGG